MDIQNQENEINNQTNKINKLIPFINKEKNLEVILMEKDKEIINLTEEKTKFNSILENIKNELKNKNLEISSLQSDIISLNNEKKLLGEEIDKNQNEITRLNNIIIDKDKIIEQSKSNLISAEKKYNDLLQEQKRENNSINQRCLNMQNEINEFNNKLLKKERDINNLENSLLKNREKDNQIFILKKQIKEQEDIINDIQNKLNLADKELQSLKTFNDERMKAFYSINHTDKNNNIISYVINKIQNLILFIDTQSNFIFQENNLEENIIEIKEDFVLYDLLDQNILLLKNKIINKYNDILRNNKENKNICLMQKNQIDDLSQNMQLIENNYNDKINQYSQKINQLQKNIQNKNEEIKKLNSKLSEITQKSLGSLSQNEFIKFYSKFISRIKSELLDKLNLDDDMEENINENKINNILNVIDFYNEKLDRLNIFVKEYENYKIKVNDIINNNMNQNKEKNDEIEELKHNNKELNILLEQSNKYLSKSRNENNLLKKRIINLEKTINNISRNNINQNNDSNYLLTFTNNNKNNKRNPFLDD